MRERDHLADLSIDARRMLKWVFKKWGGKLGLESCGSAQVQVAG